MANPGEVPPGSNVPSTGRDEGIVNGNSVLTDNDSQISRSRSSASCNRDTQKQHLRSLSTEPRNKSACQYADMLGRTSKLSIAEKKKIPMNKVKVGLAPSPNLKLVKSKVGSLDNASHRPGGGNIKIETKRIDLKNVTPRIEASNRSYCPGGGQKKIPQQKLQWNAKSRISCWSASSNTSRDVAEECNLNSEQDIAKL